MPYNFIVVQAEVALNFLNGFLETAVGIGQSFFWLLFVILLCLFAGYIMYRFRYAPVSTAQIMDGFITLLVFVGPSASIGAFFGEQLGASLPLPIETICAWVGLFLGGTLGLRLWWKGLG